MDAYHRNTQGFINPGEASAVQAALDQPQAQAVVDEQFDAVAPCVGESVGAVRACAAKPVDDAGEHTVKTQAHVDGALAQVQAVQLRVEEGCRF